MKFCEKIKDLREKNQLSQQKLAEELNLDQTTISYWENGKTFPDLHSLKRLALYFEITTDELIIESEDI